MKAPTLLVLSSLVIANLTFAENNSAALPVVTLSYDDALDSQLDHAVPALAQYKLTGSFYLVPTSDAFVARKEEWARLPTAGHEIGNHSMTHPCRSSLPDREWVPPERDLDRISAADMAIQVKKANSILTDLTGQKPHTFTPPCGDVLANNKNYIPLIKDLFSAIKGLELPHSVEVGWAPVDASGDDLIAFITEQPENVRLINFTFHGIGADYLTVSTEAHEKLLAFLNANRKKYAVKTYYDARQQLQEKPL
ncbi:polysaccharide deacetylase family protein [Alteromonas pelagimontana]|uniref:Polysaccharide deacetylase family protein n=1 Tax=Alteromonas pelagimontana TaxID=1858656 RepID=A0A6M4MB48_9ALTE|nr:polysaccharide deacetylase family protein [Alteromonas pelagimontana]QJR79785.1 polysaccharide deacetylase family protein [Alteromonas pelagimontana]